MQNIFSFVFDIFCSVCKSFSKGIFDHVYLNRSVLIHWLRLFTTKNTKALNILNVLPQSLSLGNQAIADLNLSLQFKVRYSSEVAL